MKKVFMYVNFTTYDMTIGISKKIRSEIDTLRIMGYEVWYCGYIKKGVAIFDPNDKIYVQKQYHISNRLYFRLRRFFLIHISSQFLKQEKFDIGYLRWCAFDPPYLKMLKRMKNKGGATILMESLGYFPGIVMHGLNGRYEKFWTVLNQKIAGRYIDLVLTEGNFDSMWGKPAIEFGMGVDVENITKHSYSGKKDEYHFITVANETRYHGYDRLIKSLDRYYMEKASPYIYIHFVGEISQNTKSLVNDKIKDYIVFHGKLSGEALDYVFAASNIAVGPVAQYRVGGKKDTGLKTKEYFARGIPYFYSGHEEEKLKNFKYIYQVPDDDSPIDFREIIRFYQSIDVELASKAMREYALNHYSWSGKYQKVFAYMKEKGMKYE